MQFSECVLQILKCTVYSHCHCTPTNIYENILKTQDCLLNRVLIIIISGS